MTVELESPPECVWTPPSTGVKDGFSTKVSEPYGGKFFLRRLSVGRALARQDDVGLKADLQGARRRAPLIKSSRSDTTKPPRSDSKGNRYKGPHPHRPQHERTGRSPALLRMNALYTHLHEALTIPDDPDDEGQQHHQEQRRPGILLQGHDRALPCLRNTSRSPAG